jgi:hypothetical protein
VGQRVEEMLKLLAGKLIRVLGAGSGSIHSLSS